MPTYDYECEKCGHRFELFQSMSEERKKRCPKCNATEATLIGFTPATVRTGAGKTPVPKPRALFGEPGFHVVAIACDDCDFARTAPGCPLCEAPGPLRPRP